MDPLVIEGLRTLFAIFASLVILVAGGYLAYDNGLKKRLKARCNEYAGFDPMKCFMLGEQASNEELMEGLRTKERAITKRASALVSVLKQAEITVPPFLEGARVVFPSFLAQHLARSVDKATKKKIEAIVRNIEFYSFDVEDDGCEMNLTLSAWLREWCNEATEWIEVVERLASEIAWQVEIEKNRERRKK